MKHFTRKQVNVIADALAMAQSRTRPNSSEEKTVFDVAETIISLIGEKRADRFYARLADTYLEANER